MTADIANFLSSFTSDLARPARFNVQIPIPLNLVAWRNIARTLSFRCENAELPAITLETTQRKIYGPTEIQPYARSYNTTNMTFICTDSMNEKKFFDSWIQIINPNSTYDMNYKSDYITPITINQFDVNDNIRYSVTLIDAFPLSVNQLDLDWSQESSFHKLVVTFGYYTWEQNSLDSIVSSLVGAAVTSGIDAVTNFLSQDSSYNPSSPGSSNPSWSMQSVAAGMTKASGTASGTDSFNPESST